MTHQLQGNTFALTRRGARSVVVSYDVHLSVRVGTLTNEMSLRLTETPITSDFARFTMTEVTLRKAGGEWRAWRWSEDRKISPLSKVPKGYAELHAAPWEGPFISAQNLLGLDRETAKAGDVIPVGSDAEGLKAKDLPIPAVVAAGGTVTVVGYVAQKTTLRGEVSYILLSAERKCDVEAQFDPYSGRPIRFSLHTIQQSGDVLPEVSLTLQAKELSDAGS